MTNSPRNFSKTSMMASRPRYSAAEIEQAKRDADIVKLIGQKVALSPAGDEFVGTCPFHHNATSESLHVMPKKGLYRCMRCGAAGDAVKWLQETQQLNYMEAIEQLRCARARLKHEHERILSSQNGGKSNG